MTPEPTADNTPGPLPAQAPSATPEKTPPSTAGMTTKVVKGSMWTLAGQVAPLLVSLVTTPFIIRLLGSEGYGVFILVNLIPSYFAFADFGMSLASTRFGSEAFAEGDRLREGQIVRTAAVAVLGISLPIGVGLAAGAGSIVAALNVPETLHSEATLALRLAAVAFILNLQNGVLNAPQLARLRMDVNAAITSGFRIFSQISIPLVLFFGGGIGLAMGVMVTANLFTLIAHLTASRLLLPELFRLNLSWAIFRRLLAYGGPVAATLVAASLLINLEKAVLARVTSVRELAFYSVAFSFAGMASLFSSAMIQSLMPAFSQLMTVDRRGQLSALYARAIRLNAVMILPILAGMFVVARPLFTVWGGTEFGERSTMPFYILLIGLFFNLLAYVSQALLLAAGRTSVIAKVNWLELPPYIGLTAVLSYQYGAIGAAIAWSSRVLVDCFVIIWLARRLENVGTNFLAFVKGGVVAVAALAVVPVSVAAGFSGPILFAIGLLCLSLYAGVALAWLILPEERNFLLARLFYHIGNIKNFISGVTRTAVL